jgi:hypothetical protein
MVRADIQKDQRTCVFFWQEQSHHFHDSYCEVSLHILFCKSTDSLKPAPVFSLVAVELISSEGSLTVFSKS